MHTEHRLLHREIPEIRSEDPHDRIELTTHQALEGMQEKVRKEILEKVLKNARERLLNAKSDKQRAEAVRSIVRSIQQQNLPASMLDDLGDQLEEAELVLTGDLLLMLNGNDPGLARTAILLAAGTHGREMIHARILDIDDPGRSTMLAKSRIFHSALLDYIRRPAADATMMQAQRAALEQLFLLEFRGLLVEHEKFSIEFFNMVETTCNLLRGGRRDGETAEQQKNREEVLTVLQETYQKFRKVVETTRKEIMDDGK